MMPPSQARSGARGGGASLVLRAVRIVIVRLLLRMRLVLLVLLVLLMRLVRLLMLLMLHLHRIAALAARHASDLALLAVAFHHAGHLGVGRRHRTLVHRVLAVRVHDAEVMFGVLIVILGGDPVARRRRFA